MKKMIFCLMLIFMAAMAINGALAEDSNLNGTWLYQPQSSYDYGEESAYQEIFPYAAYEMAIDGTDVKIRAHQPYAVPFALTLNEETGWFEASGKVTGSELKIGGVKISFEERMSEYGDATLVVTGGGLEQIGAELSFEKSEEGLVFDAAQAYGSWMRRGRGIDVDSGYCVYVSNFLPEHRMKRIIKLSGNYDLHVDGDSVTMINRYETDEPLGGEGVYAMDATDIEIKDGGIFAMFDDVRVKIYTDHTGMLRIFPLLNGEEFDQLAEIGYMVHGGEMYEYARMPADIYGGEPVIQTGSFLPDSRYISWEGAKRYEEEIGNLIRRVGMVTFGEGNTVSMAFDGIEHSGVFEFPDAYSCPDKDSHLFYSMEQDGYTIGISMDTTGNGFLLAVVRDSDMLMTFTLSDDVLNLPGTYVCSGYGQENGEILVWIEDESQLVIGDDLSVTQTFQGETHSGVIELYDIMHEERSWKLGRVALGSEEYEIILDNGSYVNTLILLNENRQLDYHAAGDDSSIKDEPDAIRVKFNYGVSVYNAQPDAQEQNKLFNTFCEGVFHISDDWSEVWFEQADVSLYMPEDLLFVQDGVMKEIPTTGLEIRSEGTPEEVRILQLDLHGNEASLVINADGTSELIIGIYHLSFMREG